MIGLRPVARRLLTRSPAVGSIRTSMHFKFEPDDAPAELGPTVKLNMCNAIKDAIGQVIELNQIVHQLKSDTKILA